MARKDNCVFDSHKIVASILILVKRCAWGITFVTCIWVDLNHWVPNMC